MKITIKRMVWKLMLGFCAWGPSMATAATDLGQAWAVAESLNNAARSTGDGSAALVQREQLAELLGASDRPVRTEAAASDFGRLVSEAWTGTRRHPVELAKLLTPTFQQFYAGRSGEAGIVMGALLWPYLQEAGLCQGDPVEDQGARCAFVFGTRAASIDGTLGDAPIPAVDPKSQLGLILSSALGGGVAAKGLYDDGGAGHGTGEVSYSYMDTVTITAQYGYFYAFQLHCTTSCRASAAGYGTINGQYLATGSDMVFAAVSAALYCDFTCSIGTAYEAYRDRDAIAYALKNGDKRYQPVHGASKAIHVLADYCGVVPTQYGASPLYISFKDQPVPVPYDTGVKLAFGTYAQKPPVPTTMSSSPFGSALHAPNLFPAPTRESLAPTRSNSQVVGGNQVWFPFWTYEFNTLTAWKFDIMFAAVQNANAIVDTPLFEGANCRTYLRIADFVSGSKGGAYGDQFWIWHGGATTGDYDLPEVKLIFGYFGGRDTRKF